MFEPTLALQTAVRAVLITDPEITAHVEPDNVRAAPARPARRPSIILTGSQTEFLGRASGGQIVARAWLDVNVWALEDGTDLARAIGFAVCQRLFDTPPAEDFAIDEWIRPGMVWMRDPQPERAYTHGVASLEAVIRWVE